ALVSAQALGQAAEKEKARRKQNEKTGTKAPVITDEELKNNKGRLANDPGGPGAATPSTAAGSAAPADPAPGDEQTWRARMAQARANVAQTTRAYELWTSVTLPPGGSIVDPHGRPIADVQQLQHVVAEVKAAMVAAQKWLSDLEDTARRQN